MGPKTILAALVLTLALAAGGCGATAGAGANAGGWTREDARTNQYLNEARGPLSDGAYTADEDGRVKGFDRTDAGRALDRAGDAARQTGRELMQGAKDAAKNAGDMAEEGQGTGGAHRPPGAELSLCPRARRVPWARRAPPFGKRLDRSMPGAI